MAIRSRIKSLIKRTLFSSSTSESTHQPTPDPFKKEPVKTEPVVSANKVVATPKDLQVPNPSSAVAPEITKSDDSAVEPSEEKNTVETTELGEATDAIVEISEEDKAKASFIVKVEHMFPETCSNCGASSYGNWIRVENKFACGSCENVYK